MTEGEKEREREREGKLRDTPSSASEFCHLAGDFPYAVEPVLCVCVRVF